MPIFIKLRLLFPVFFLISALSLSSAEQKTDPYIELVEFCKIHNKKMGYYEHRSLEQMCNCVGAESIGKGINKDYAQFLIQAFKKNPKYNIKNHKFKKVWLECLTKYPLKVKIKLGKISSEPPPIENLKIINKVAKAKISDRINLCKELQDSSCMSHLIKTTNNVKICELTKDEDCYFKLALHYRTFKYCQFFQNKKKNLCRFLLDVLKSKKRSCNSLKGDIKIICQVSQSRNVKFCKNVKSEKWKAECIYLHALANSDTRICQAFPADNEKSKINRFKCIRKVKFSKGIPIHVADCNGEPDCVILAAVSSNNGKICKKLKDPEKMGMCLLQVAVNQKNIGICNQLWASNVTNFRGLCLKYGRN